VGWRRTAGVIFALGIAAFFSACLLRAMQFGEE
jgi:hypothetical protein